MRAKKPRFRFMEDDDGHTYLIPVGQENEFRAWLVAITDEDGKDVDPELFDLCHFDGDPSRITFEAPLLQEEK